MSWRLAPAVLVLAAFIAALTQVFAREERDAIEEIDGRRRALEQYAAASLQRRLHDALASALPRIDAAAKDPLVDAEGTLLISEGVRVLPPAPPQPISGALADDDEASELPFVAAVRDAKDHAALEAAVRGLLAHRARWRTPVEHDVEAVTQVVELLLERGTPTLLKGLLREGFQGQDGLQRRILRGRTQLEPATLARLCARVALLSRRAQIPADDFEARCAEEPIADGALPDPAALPEGPTQLQGWYVEREGSLVRGVRIDLEHERAAVREQMRTLGLVGPADWEAATSRARSLFRLKAGLLGLVGALGLLAAGLVSVAQRRKQRFVELKEDFVAAVSHELKTPLASMRVMAETLETRLTGNPQAKDYPQRLVSEVDGLTALVENILSFNRLDKGRLKPQLSRVSLASLVPVLRDDAPKASVTFDGFDGAVLEADAELLKLCLLNLLRNACRYNVRETPEVRFSFDGRVMRVADNGIGIPVSEHERVFDDFVRLKAVPRAGTGLGLALCRRVMQLHGGSIGIERSSPEGTVFALRFATPRA
ncbi:MAG: HAMP domain-containing histidine kinase [Myxococcaceae bacterium]|nr:HAMP domain-containing histidine kinase [Myxococcaceae bacterium]